MNNVREAPGIWIGKDIVSTETTVIPRQWGNVVPVDLAAARSSVPDTIQKGDGEFFVSTRSAWAQLGVEVPRSSGIKVNGFIRRPKIATIKLPLENHSLAPIEVEQGGVGRLLYRNGPPLRGNILRDLQDQGEITLGGDKDSWWTATHHGETIGIGMYLDPVETWIRPQTEPIRKHGETTETFREEMKKYLVPIGQGDQPSIRIGHTASTLFTQEGYIALIEPSIRYDPREETRVANMQHINSPALYPAYPAKPWHIRTETLSTPKELNPTTEQLPRKAIIVTFYPTIRL
ncbi:MAG TPA: hypothetical protein VLF93_04430 [Candidatus Saccharimonadales bacterium]|nr:hypothetical protein [Candidatus Saccharimonadales bacterium]